MAASTDISKLKELYASLDRHTNAGEDVVADIRQEINNIELQYLKEDVFPELMRLLAKRTSGLRCTIDMSLQFDGEHTIDYSFCKSGSSFFIRENFECDTDENVDSQIESSPEEKIDTEEFSMVKPTVSSPSPTSLSPASQTAIRIVKYSEKAIAVYGDTRQYAEQFKTIGGYFNARLREGAGWIFSKKREAEIRELLNLKPDDQWNDDEFIVTSKQISAPKASRTTFSAELPKGSKCTLESFRTYLSKKKNSQGRIFSLSSVGVYCTTTRSNYMRSKVLKYHPSGYLYNITNPSIISELIEDIQDDFVHKRTNSSSPQAVRQYLDFVTDCILPKSEPEAQAQTIIAVHENIIIDDEPVKRTKSPWIVINSIEFDSYCITEGNPTHKYLEFIRLIGPELVYQMRIPHLGGYLVDTKRNPKYLDQCKQIDDESGVTFWVNTHCNTTTKIRFMQQIGTNLGVEVKIEIADGIQQLKAYPTENRNDLSSSSRSHFSINGSGNFNKRKTVLAVVRLYMQENPRATWNDVVTDFPKEIQGGYGIVATLKSVLYRINNGFDDEKRYFIDADKVLKTIDDVKFVVCTQWGNQFSRFQEYVTDKFGWTISQV